MSRTSRSSKDVADSVASLDKQFRFQDGEHAEFGGCIGYLRDKWQNYDINPETGTKGWKRSYIFCFPDICQAKTCCLYNLIFSPFVLCYHAWRIYFCGCLSIHIRRGFLRFCCCCCRAFDYSCKCCGIPCHCCAWMYTDRKFPPCPASLGMVGGDSADLNASKTNIEDTVWLRASSFSKQGKKAESSLGKLQNAVTGDLSDSKMVLYSDGISSSDIMQGALGDCWLLAAMACMAEVRGGIDNLFITKEFDPRGKYRIQLFDGTAKNGEGQWKIFTIDDFIPCERKAYNNGINGKSVPKFSKPNGNELWVMLLEKAFAKMCGSYASLEGGSTIWALRAMTGDHCRWYYKDKKGGINWERKDFHNVPDTGKQPVCPHCLRPVARDKRGSTLKDTDERLSRDEMFDTLLRYKNRRSVLCASGADRMDGLVSGHAYSILDVVRIKSTTRTGSCTLKLLLIRNPWGSGEWTGDWSDRSEKWDEFSDLKLKLLPDATNGAFWMSWEDYCDHWDRIGIADRTLDVNSLHYNYPQEQPCLGPTKGLFMGCWLYWCNLMGCRRLYCPKRSSEQNVALDGDGKPICCGCSKATVLDKL